MHSIQRSLAIAVTVAVAARASAQTPPILTLTQTLRLDATTEDFSAFTLNRQGNAPYYVGPHHEIVLPLGQDATIRIYDSTGKRVTTLGRKGSGPGEYRNIFRIGLRNDTTWVYDAVQRRMTYYDPKWTLLRSSVFSDALRQPVDGPDPHAITDFGPSGIAPDGRFIGQIVTTNGKGTDGRLILKYFVGTVAADNAVTFLQEIPTQAVSPRVWVPMTTAAGAASVAYAIVPFANDALYAFSTAGDRFAMLTTNRTAHTYTVTVRHARGDTIFSRSYPFEARAIPSSVRDSAIAASTKNARYPAPVIAELQARLGDSVPKAFPPVTSVTLARDGTTWLRVRRPTGDDMAMVLDAKGNVTGTIALRTGLDVVEAEGARVWAVDVDADGLASVVVFRSAKVNGTGRGLRR